MSIEDNKTSDTTVIPSSDTVDRERRNFFRASASMLMASAMMGIVPEKLGTHAWAAGSDAPELTEVKIGFIPLTDCAPVVIASKMGFDKKYGIKITPSKEASWAGVRDKVVNGELHAAHMLYGMVYGVQLGVGSQQKDMSILLTLNQNGQAITLSNQLKEKGITSGTDLKRLLGNEKREFTFAQTFPTGTHAMWLYYWLASYGIDPFKDIKTIVVPPPQMVANMRIGNMDGYCVGEPWNARAIHDKIGFTAATSQEIWPEHPEKVLGTTADFVNKYPKTALAITKAILEACRYIDTAANRPTVAKLIAGKAYVNAPEAVIEGRFLGHYDNGIGKKWEDPHYMKFFDDGKASFPYLSDGMWFMTQHKRWGLLKTDPDYLAVAKKVNRIDIYTEAAKSLGISVPSDPMRSSKLIDGVIWDGKDPKAYANGFKIKA